MRELLNTLGKTLLDIGNFGMLLVLFMYIYALVGLQFFANRFHFNEEGQAVPIGEEGYYAAEVPRSNFDTLMNAFTTIFEVSLPEMQSQSSKYFVFENILTNMSLIKHQ